MIFNILNLNASAQEKFVLIAAFAAAAMTSIMFHEFAHAYIALKNGDLTAKLSGRLNLNPRSHFDLFGLLMFFVAGFGWAKPVPINPDNFENKKKGVFTTAIAGVTMNLMLRLWRLGF
jgi:Peptidase family M50.